MIHRSPSPRRLVAFVLFIASCDPVDPRDPGVGIPDGGQVVEVAPSIPRMPGGDGGLLVGNPEVVVPLPFDDGRYVSAGDAGFVDAAVLGLSCKAGETICASPTDAVECNPSGEWGEPVACENACVKGGCGGECSPGTEECVSSTQIRACSESGSWGEASDCDNACVGSSCSGECRPGESRCATGASVQICGTDGLWGDDEPCENACLGNACTGECVPGASRCFSTREIQRCNDEGQWLTPIGCDAACRNDVCGGECVPGSRRCNPQSGAPQACSDDGTWQNESACPFVCLGSGSCGGQCLPGTRRCNPTSGIPQQCSDAGNWQNQSACPFVCSGNGACTGECSPGARRCNPQSGIPQLCSAGAVWQNQAACPFVCTGNGTCTGECRAPATRCVGSRLESCQSFQWETEDTCFGPEFCDAEAGVCVANDCENDTDPSSSIERHPRYGCGQRWALAGDPTGAWVVFDMGLHVDLETGNGWFAPGGSLTLAELTAQCRTLSVDGIGGWSVPTIDQVRELAAGCAPTESGGSCRLSDPSCLTQACGQCSSCLGGGGPADGGSYCRPNTQLCFGLHTRSTCSDCDVASDWSYGVSNGNVLARSSTTRFGSFCVRPNVPF